MHLGPILKDSYASKTESTHAQEATFPFINFIWEAALAYRRASLLTHTHLKIYKKKPCCNRENINVPLLGHSSCSLDLSRCFWVNGATLPNTLLQVTLWGTPAWTWWSFIRGASNVSFSLSSYLLEFYFFLSPFTCSFCISYSMKPCQS